MIEYNDLAQAVIRGFRRNAAGLALVKHPNTYNSDLAYPGASGGVHAWPFDRYDGISMVYADRGTLVHELTERIDTGTTQVEDLYERGAEIGMEASLIDDIGLTYKAFRAAHGLTVATLADGRLCVEVPSVCDVNKIATPIDRVDIHDGNLVVADIKTSRVITRAAYAVQLKLCTMTRPYDDESGHRGDWPGTLRTDIAYIYHLPLTAILQGEAPVAWDLWKVTL